MEDLTLEDLKIITMVFERCQDAEGISIEAAMLFIRIDLKIGELEELANMDLDDCAGGACKL